VFDGIKLDQLTQLGVGGLFAVILLYMILSMLFKFLADKKGITERIMDKIEDQNQKTSFAVQTIAKAIDNQTRLLEKLSDQALLNYAEIKELNLRK
jgi:hypothetical protein